MSRKERVFAWAEINQAKDLFAQVLRRPVENLHYELRGNVRADPQAGNRVADFVAVVWDEPDGGE